MEPANQSQTTGNRGRLIDFAPSKNAPAKVAPAPTKEDGAPAAGQVADSTGANTTKNSSTAPTPVMSAQAAINAMYAARAAAPTKEKVVSAREVVNAAASQNAAQTQKSAANLHHGSLQKSIESTRTSASALLKMAKGDDESKVDIKASNSFDPLSKQRLVPAKPRRARATNHGEIPIVRTSLKLGANARPHPEPVILPANSRIANQAQVVGASSRLTASAQVRPKQSRLLGRAQSTPAPARPNLAPRRPRVIGDGIIRTAPSAGIDTATPAKPVSAARTHGSLARDPQMVGYAKSATANRSARELQNVRAAEIIDEQMGQPTRFRSAARGYATNRPAPMPADNSYVMSEPPRINAKKTSSNSEDDTLGVVKNYYPASTPGAIGDKSPIGRVNEQKIASGHGGSAEDYNSIKANNTSNYSFSRQPNANSTPYALGGQSPFLKSVNVEKRPLSDNRTYGDSKLVSHTAVVQTNAIEKSNRSSRKNTYPKKATKAIKANATKTKDLPTRPTVIVPSSHRSKVPLFFLVMITVVLGAAVGAAAYLCFFQ